jgi:AraC-like DNA-binding protein
MKRYRKRLEQQLHYRAIILLIDVKPHEYHLVTGDWVAQQLEVTPQHLSSRFFKETEFNFGYFLEKIKVCWSVWLIKENSGLHVNELAEIIGYNKVYQFIKLFKKHMGTTPARFRNTLRKTEKEQLSDPKRQLKNKKNVQNFKIN